jgi:vacuolar protein sorting-associated protein 13A/C
MRRVLQSVNPEQQTERRIAKKWFTDFDTEFNLEHAANIRFNSHVLKSNIQSAPSSKPSGSKISVIVVVADMHVLVQENEMLNQLKSLHQQVNIFKKELDNKQQLRDQVLEHIKVNFLNRMSQMTS